MDSLIQSFEAWITKKIDERLTVQINTGNTPNNTTLESLNKTISELEEQIESLERQVTELDDQTTNLERDIENVFDGFDVTAYHDMEILISENIDMNLIAREVIDSLEITVKQRY
tara:strand:+ start:408 stop:752 length:345 start_codon:yes stop_codon:yes gene_type:complete